MPSLPYTCSCYACNTAGFHKTTKAEETLASINNVIKNLKADKNKNMVLLGCADSIDTIRSILLDYYQNQ